MDGYGVPDDRRFIQGPESFAPQFEQWQEITEPVTGPAYQAPTAKPAAAAGYGAALTAPQMPDLAPAPPSISPQMPGDEWEEIPRMQEAPTLPGRVQQRWQLGEMSVELGYLQTRKMFGETDPEIDRRIEQIRLMMPREEWEKRGIVERIATETAQMAPTMAAGMKEGMKRGVTLGTGFAGIAAWAGMAGPQAITPEEVVTVPGAAAAGYAIGMTSGMLESIGRIEAGLAYDELINYKDPKTGEQLNPEVAKWASLGVGVVNAALELFQIKMLMKTIPGGRKILHAATTGAMKKLLTGTPLKRLAMRSTGAVKFLAGETTQEVAQEASNIVAQAFTTEITNQLEGTKIAHQTKQQIFDRLKDVAESSLYAFAGMGMPGAITTIGGELRRGPKPAAPREAGTELRDMLSPTEGIPEHRRIVTKIKEDTASGALNADQAEQLARMFRQRYPEKHTEIDELQRIVAKLNQLETPGIEEGLVPVGVTGELARKSAEESADAFERELEQREQDLQSMIQGQQLQADLTQEEAVMAGAEAEAAMPIVPAEELYPEEAAVEEDEWEEITPESEVIDRAAIEAEPPKSPEQAAAGTYKKGHIKLHDLDISIETPRGEKRRGISGGKAWETKMTHHYGYILGYKGKDKDHVDVFIGPDPALEQVYIVDQFKVGMFGPTTFDEHKIMMGFPTEQQARMGYMSNYEKGWRGLGQITSLSMDQFKTWLDKADKNQQVSEWVKTPEGAELPPSEAVIPPTIDEEVEEVVPTPPEEAAKEIRGKAAIAEREAAARRAKRAAGAKYLVQWIAESGGLCEIIERDLRGALTGVEKERVVRLEEAEKITEADWIDGYVEHYREELRNEGYTEEEIEEILKGEPTTEAVVRTKGFNERSGEIVSVIYRQQRLTSHPEYQAAKSGDPEAARNLVDDLLTDEKVASIDKQWPGDIIYQAVNAVEAAGNNAIPQALASRLFERNGKEIGLDIFQDNKAFHTGKGAMERIISRPVFAGTVQPGGRYVLIDDVVTMGGTYAELANHIQENGGEVVGIICLTNAARMTTLYPSPQLITTLKERYGDTIRQELGIAPEALTRPEAEYLSRFKTVDSFRAKIASAKRAAYPPEGVREEGPVYVKGQAPLFEEPPPKFELKPTEPTPAEAIALKKAKGELVTPAERKAAVFPTEKVPVATKGKQSVLFGKTKEGDQYDLFDQGAPKVGEVQYVYEALTKPEQIKFDWNVAPAVKPADKAQPLPINVITKTTGWIAAEGNVIADVDYAISLFAGIRKGAQEEVYAAYVDKNGVILEIMRYSKGTHVATPLQASDVVGRAFNIPGTARVYVVHNHPSMDPGLSKQDLTRGYEMEELAKLKNIGVDFAAIGGTQFQTVKAVKAGNISFYPIKPMKRRQYIAVRERRLIRRRVLTDLPKIRDNTEAVKYWTDNFDAQNGVIIVDNHHRPLAMVPFIKGKKMADFTRDLIGEMELVNGSFMLVMLNNPTLKEKNYAGALAQVGLVDKSVLDIVINGTSTMYGHAPKPFAEHAYEWQQMAGETVFSIATEPRVNVLGNYEISDFDQEGKDRGKITIAKIHPIGIPIMIERTRKWGKKDDVARLQEYYDLWKVREHERVEALHKELDARSIAAREIIQELSDNGYRIRYNRYKNTLLVYHGTSTEAVQQIRSEGRFHPDSYFSHAKGKSAFGSQGAADYARIRSKKGPGEVITIEVDPRDIEFQSGTGEIVAYDGLIRDSDGVWKAPRRLQDGQTRLALSKDVTDEDLVAYHNTTIDELMAADESGGLAMPSLAITRRDIPFEKYGQLTLIAHRSLVDPQLSGVRVFDADVYSPTVPGRRWDVKTDKAWTWVQAYIPYFEKTAEYKWRMHQELDKGFDNAMNEANRSTGLQYAFLEQVKGKALRIPRRPQRFYHWWMDFDQTKTWAKEYTGSIHDIGLHSKEHKEISDVIWRGIETEHRLEKDAELRNTLLKIIREDVFDAEGFLSFGSMAHMRTDIETIKTDATIVDEKKLETRLKKEFTPEVSEEYRKWCEKQLRPLFGDPYVMVGRKKMPYTLGNIFASMQRAIRASQKNIVFGPGSARALAAREFGSIMAMHKAKGRITTDEAVHEYIDKIQRPALDKITDRLIPLYRYTYEGRPDTWAALNDTMRAIGSFLKGRGKTVRGLQYRLEQHGFGNVPESVAGELLDWGISLQNAPTAYFEAKVTRIVDFDEFAGVVAPADAPLEFFEMLKRRKLPYEVYKTPAQRQEAVQKFHERPNVLFSTETGSRTPLSPDGGERLSEISELVYKTLELHLPDSISDRIKIELRPIIHLTGDDISKTMKEHGMDAVTPERIMGATTFQNLTATVQLATSFDKPLIERATFHEAYHLSSRWLLPEKDYKAIMKHFEGNEEAAAEAFSDWAIARKGKDYVGPPSNIQRIFLIFRRYLILLRNALAGKGFTRPEDIFGKIYTKQYPYLIPRPSKGARFALGTKELEERYFGKRTEKQEAAEPKQVKAVEDKLDKLPTEEDRPRIPSTFEEAEDDWFGDHDWAKQVSSAEAHRLQIEIAKAVGDKNILGNVYYSQRCKDVDQAIHIYLDIKRNPNHVSLYWDQLTAEQQRIVTLAGTIEHNPRLKAIADYISGQYDKIGKKALGWRVIFNTIDNYVGRAWKVKKPGQAATDTLQKFKITSRHAKHRVFETILEGWATREMELKVTAATNNLEMIKNEISRVVEDKRLISQLRKMKWRDTDEPVITHAPKSEDYKEIQHPNFIYWMPDITIKAAEAVKKYWSPDVRIQENWAVTKKGKTRATRLFDREEQAQAWIDRQEDPDIYYTESRHYLWRRHKLYAPSEIAKKLNNVLGVSKLRGGLEVRGISMIDLITKYNAILKSIILMTGFFHHQAFLRSYLLGTRHKTAKEWNPFRAYKEGLKAIKALTPEIQLLVRNGLTLGRMQDWEEAILQDEDTVFGKILAKTKYTNEFRNWVNNLRERQARFLFQRFGAGLKARAGLIELRNALKDPANEGMAIEDIAKMVAELINDDFGGLHLRRMHRNPTTQHIFRLLALAPDWCVDAETRAMTKTGWKAYNELEIGDEILAFDPESKQLRWSKLKDKYVNENYSGKMVQVNNFNRSVMMTPDHTCYVYNSTTKRNDIVKACELQTNHQIPRCADFAAPTKQIYDDYFVKIVGWMVTDGYIKTDTWERKDGTFGKRDRGLIKQAKPHTVQILKDMGLSYYIDNSNCDHDKFISRYPAHVFSISKSMVGEFKRANLGTGLNWEFLSKLTHRQRQLLYDTMMLGDGTGQKRFCGKEKEVFYMTLLQTMLGLPSTFYQQEENCWRTRWITRGKGISCWGHHNNKIEVDYEGSIWCPSVDTGFWLAERQGLMFITGNTESNVNTAWKSFTGGSKQRRHFYRKFWTSVLTKGLLATTIGNFLLAFADDDDLMERYRKAWAEGWHKLRWLDIDITPLARLFTDSEPEARRYFSILGHFRDPIKFVINTFTAAMHKSSVFSRILLSFAFAIDWKGHGFTTISEFMGVDDKGLYLVKTKEHEVGERKGGKLAGKLVTAQRGGRWGIQYAQIPSYLIEQTRGMTPIQVQAIITRMMGEIDSFDMVMRMAGAHASKTWPTPKKLTAEWVDQWIRARRAGESVLPLRKRVDAYNAHERRLGQKGEPINWTSVVQKAMKQMQAERAAEQLKARR